MLCRCMTLALTAGAAALSLTSLGTAAPRVAPVPTTIATLSSLDYRAVLTAQRESSGAAPTAAVRLVIYSRAGGEWHRAATHRLSGTFFWKTVTAPHGICEIDLRTTGTPRLAVQLLESPSVGCGRTQTFALGVQGSD